MKQEKKKHQIALKAGAAEGKTELEYIVRCWGSEVDHCGRVKVGDEGEYIEPKEKRKKIHCSW
jgi:hypothetical protein